LPSVVRIAPVKGAFLVTEQLGLEQILGIAAQLIATNAPPRRLLAW
jgi:hypothetical protein